MVFLTLISHWFLLQQSDQSSDLGDRIQMPSVLMPFSFKRTEKATISDLILLAVRSEYLGRVTWISILQKL